MQNSDDDVTIGTYGMELHCCYCYMGTHSTFFTLHCENMYLGAMNYLHWGRPKVWFIVAGTNATKMEKIVFELLTPSIAKQYNNKKE